MISRAVNDASGRCRNFMQVDDDKRSILVAAIRAPCKSLQISTTQWCDGKGRIHLHPFEETEHTPKALTAAWKGNKPAASPLADARAPAFAHSTICKPTSASR